jgi:hypothetical protein
MGDDGTGRDEEAIDFGQFVPKAGSEDDEE